MIQKISAQVTQKDSYNTKNKQPVFGSKIILQTTEGIRPAQDFGLEVDFVYWFVSKLNKVPTELKTTISKEKFSAIFSVDKQYNKRALETVTDLNNIKSIKNNSNIEIKFVED